MKTFETMTETEKVEHLKAKAELAARLVWHSQDNLHKARKLLTSAQEASRLAQIEYSLAYGRALREGHVVLDSQKQPGDTPEKVGSASS